MIIGKTRMPEFGQWPFTESVDGGYTRNPWNPGHTPGGSSGGTAVAVAAGMVPVGIGGDGGGSIRIPSACCGLFGLKPQRGRVTTAPMEHLWWSLGTVGPLTRSVLDSAIVYDAIRGNTATDLFRADEPPTSFTEAARAEPGRLRIGWSTKSQIKGLRPDRTHVEAVRSTAQLLSDLGHEVVEVDPHYPDATLAFVPQFFAGVRTEADAVEHYDRLEKRTRETYRLGSWVRPGVVQWALRAGEKVAREGQPGLRRRRRAAHPDHRAPAAQGRRAGQGRHRPGRAGRAADDRLRRAVEHHRQPGRVGPGGGRAPTGFRWRCSWSGAGTTRPRCSACPRSWRRLARGRCRARARREPAAHPEGAGTPPPGRARRPARWDRRCRARWPAGSCW